LAQAFVGVKILKVVLVFSKFPVFFDRRPVSRNLIKAVNVWFPANLVP
jgi:hypothetical protein